MNFSRFAFTAFLVFGVAQAAAAQSPAPAAGATGTTGVIDARAPAPAAAQPVDVSRLPVDMNRIERRFRQSLIREEREGLNLRYFVEVFAPAPKLQLFTKQDNLEHGPAPYGGPTHREMLDMMTPRYFRHLGGIDVLNR